jgi:phosphatidylserine decarboxylase
MQISIFLSPLNVHVNRIPLNGVVKFLKYVKGEYLVAFDPKSSERNERSEIGIENEINGHKVLFKQIAGFVARRIVYDIKEGSVVKSGDRFGMIKFGSRVDIIVKRETKIFVKLDQIVTGGETIIAEL